MPRNGSGTAALPYPQTTGAGTTIVSAYEDANRTDIAAMLTASIAADGQTTTSAAIPFAVGITLDTIGELTGGAGVTIDGVLIKDGQVDGVDVSALADFSGLTPTDGNVIVGNGSNWVAESGATARTSLGLTIGTNVQAWDANLDQIAGETPTDGAILVGQGSVWQAESGATLRSSIGVGTADSPTFAALTLGSGGLSSTQAAESARAGIFVKPAGTAGTVSTVRAQGHSSSFEVINGDTTQNWYFGVNDASSNRLEIGRGYGPGQGVTTAIAIDTSDNVSMAAGLAVSGAITVSGTVDGIDIAGTINQGVKTSDTPTFASAAIATATGANVSITTSGTDSSPYLQLTNDARTWLTAASGATTDDDYVITDSTDSNRARIQIKGGMGALGTFRFSGTAAANFHFGLGKPGDNACALFLYSVGGASEGTYSLQITRDGGANGLARIRQTGTGDLRVETDDAAEITFRPNGSDRWRVGTDGTFYPDASNAVDIGKAAKSVKDIYVVNAVTVTSDARRKRDAAPCPGLDFIGALDMSESAWRWVDGTRTHWGPMAQSVKGALDTLGIDAGVFVDPSVSGQEGGLMIRPTELFGPVIRSIQQICAVNDNHEDRITALEEENAILRAEIEELKAA